MRLERKLDHIENYLKTEYVGDTLFDQVFLEHDALTDLSTEGVDTSLEFLGKKLDFPILINAMTGGPEIANDINRDLAAIARDYGLAMATGSEKIALDEPDCKNSFEVARKENPHGLVLGNISARETLEEAQMACDIIAADGLEVHLNPAQELIMEEGDRNLGSQLDNIEKINRGLGRPVIVKEVGYGISASNAKKLYDKGIRYIDIGGAGGTSFIEIEDLRSMTTDFSDLYGWGNPTAYLLETYKGLPEDLFVIASGGIKTASHIVKSLVMGADMVGISGEILKYLLHGGEDYARSYIESLIYKAKVLMALVGAKDLASLKKVNYKTFGRLRDLTN